MRAYLDEAGQPGPDYVIIAGHIGWEQNWEAFVPAWNSALGPQRKRLHMRRLRWNKASQQLLYRLASVPADCGLARLVGGTKVSDYADLVAGKPSEILLNGYICALFEAVTTLLLTIPDDERVELAFEHTDRYKDMASRTLEIIAEDKRYQTTDGKPKLAKWSFIPKDSTMLFDQADYLCSALLQNCRNANSKKAKWCASLLEGGGTIGGVMSRDRIRHIVDKTNKDFATIQRLMLSLRHDANAQGKTA